MTIDEMKQYYLDQIIWSAPPRQSGGQSVGRYDPTVIGEVMELNIKIQVGYHRTQLKNKDLVHTLISLALDDIIH